jgi:membrane-associated phospholipid phosphatase
MQLSIRLSGILVTGCFFLLSLQLSAQNWEADIVRTANGSKNSSDIWRITNNTVKPISAGLPFALLAGGLIAKDKKIQRESLQMMGGLLLTVATTEGLKVLVNRKRPYEEYTGIYPNEIEAGKSFPSGHASVAYFTAASLSINHPKWYVIAPAYGWAFGVSYARLYYGQHNPTDLVGSVVVGTGSAWLSYKATQWLHKKKKPVQEPVL